MAEQLPELPEPDVRCGEYAGAPGEGASENLWGSDSMRSYALSAIKELEEMVARAEKDAARYRWLRGRHWHDSDLCVVTSPKLNVRPGSSCPSEELLDDEIDAAIDAARAGAKP